MPEAAEKHGEHQIDVGADFAKTIATETDVEIVAKPGTEADVPAAPEVLETFGEVRLPKINHEMKAHKLGAAAGDAAIAAEVSIDLPGECVSSEQDGHDI